jgi:S1-C subfamily serine protease
VHGARTIRVTFPGEPVLDAGIVRVSERDDVALLRTGSPVPHWLTFGDPERVRPGDRVFTVGYPVADFLGEEPKYTDGAVSSLTGAEGDARRMQVSVPIQPGNSGGPLLNEEGRVVGIVVATASSQEFEWATGVAPQNVNWAVKAGPASRMVEEELGELPAAPPATDRGAAVARARASVCFVETGPPLEDEEEIGPAVDSTSYLEAPARNRAAAGRVRRRAGGGPGTR